MLSVNIAAGKTEAYVKSSVVSEKAGTAGVLNTTIKATDDSGIVAVAGAVGVSTSNAIGAAIGYNEIDNDVLAYLDDVDLTTDGSLTIEATLRRRDRRRRRRRRGQRRRPAASLAGAGSLLINKITNTVQASIDDTVTAAGSRVAGSAVSVGGTVSLKATGRLADRLDRGRRRRSRSTAPPSARR